MCLAALISILSVGLGIHAWSGPSELQGRVELLLYHPGLPEAVLARGGPSSHILLLTAIRASQQLGKFDDLPPSTERVVEEAFAAVEPGDPEFSFGALEDLLTLQKSGVLTDVALPVAVRDSVHAAAVRDLAGPLSRDPNVVAERLVNVRSARLLGFGDLRSHDLEALCTLADQALIAGHVDVAALFAELASPDPDACTSEGRLEAWTAQVEAAAKLGAFEGVTYFGPRFLTEVQSQALAEQLLAAMAPDVATGYVPFRTLEVVTRLVRHPIALDRLAPIATFLRRQVLLQGSVADQMGINDWDRITTAGVLREVGLHDTDGDIDRLRRQPLSSALGNDSSLGLIGAIAFGEGDRLSLPPATDGIVQEAARLPGVLAAVTLRTGDCSYLGAADISQNVPADPFPGLLVRFGLTARAAAVCGVDPELTARLGSQLDYATDKARHGGVGGQWAASEVTCLRGGQLSQEIRASGKSVAETYVATVIGPDPQPIYSSEDLYAALRLQDLARGGCDGQGWWTGMYRPS